MVTVQGRSFVYGQDGKFITSFASKGNKDGQFNTSHGLVVDTRGEKPVLLWFVIVQQKDSSC